MTVNGNIAKYYCVCFLIMYTCNVCVYVCARSVCVYVVCLFVYVWNFLKNHWNK